MVEDVVVNKFTFAISSPGEFLVSYVTEVDTCNNGDGNIKRNYKTN